MKIVWIYAILLLISLSFTPMAQAQQPNECINPAAIPSLLVHLNFYIRNDTQETWILHKKTLNPCNLDDPKIKVIQALSYLDQLEREAKNNSTVKTTSLVFQEGPLTFFKSRVKNIYFETKSTAVCSQNTVAYTLPWDKDSMYICSKNWKELSHSSQFSIGSTLIHEAQHLSDSQQHVPCLHGFFLEYDILQNNTQKSLGCDKDYESQGSYGMETAFQMDIYKITTTPAEKLKARMEVIYNLLTRFNKLPLHIKQGKLTVSQNKGVLFYPDITTEDQAPFIQKTDDNFNRPYSKILDIKMNFNAAVLYENTIFIYSNEDEASAYAYSKKLYHANDDLSQFYNTQLKSTEHQSLLDVFYDSNTTDYGCFLFKNSLLCKEKNSTKTHKITFSTLRPQGFYILKNAATRQQTISVVDQNGISYIIPNQFSTLSRLDENALLLLAEVQYKNQRGLLNSHPSFENPLQLLPTLINLPLDQFINKTFNLPQEHILEKIKTAQSTWVLGPFYWSKEIESL